MAGTEMQRRGSGLAGALRERLMGSAALAIALGALAPAAFAAGPALPTGGSVAAGTAAISSSGAGALIVQQSSNRAVINWSSFSIGQGGHVTFDNGTGATLNRVSSGAPISALNGTLSATGSVYLINPSGVIVGKTGVINVGGTFVASTQDIADSGFMAGGSLTFAGGSNGAVINYGRIGALGGDVVLIASQVANQGTISAPNGAVGLLAGYQVVLKDQADANGYFSVLVGGAGTSATNAGTISAAAAELRAEQGNIYALAGNTAGVIRATEVSGSGGDIQLLAPGGTVQVASGAVLDASAGAAGNGGHIQIDSADTTFAGTALARGGATGGDGGLIETSGTQVNFTGAHIDTTAAAGKTGEWLVDPTDLTIDTSNNATLSADLATTSVVLQTTSSGASGIVGTQTATGSTKGDINIDAAVSWSSTSTLTLEAFHSIYINAPMTITGAGANAGKLVMTTNAAATDGDLFFSGGGSVQFTGLGGSSLTGHLTIDSVNYTLEGSYANFVTAANTNPSGNYALAASVAATSGTQAPIAHGTLDFGTFEPSSGDTPFTGRIEGLGNTIGGLSITDNSGVAGSTLTLDALVGYLGTNGVIRDLGVTGVAVSGASGVAEAGAIVGYSRGSVINSWSSGSVTASTVGGLIGENAGGGTISGSHSSATVTVNGGGGSGGGLVGQNGDSETAEATITNAYATGAVSDGASDDALIGGLVGANGVPGVGGTINRSYATGAVQSTGDGTFAGGLVGRNGDTILDSYASGSVSVLAADAFAGGLVGVNDFNIVNAYASGRVTATAPGMGGGLIGSDDSAFDGGDVQNVHYDSTVNSSLSGVGTNDTANGAGPDVTVTGLATSALQGGTLPAGLNSSVSFSNALGNSVTTSTTAWGAASGFYPFLNFQYPHGAVEVSGTVFSGYDTSPAATGLTVALSSFGTIQSTALTTAGGAYALLADGGQQSEVLLSGDSSHANTYLGTPTTSTTANLYAGYLRLPSASTSLSSTLAEVALAAGNNSGADYLYTAANGLAANTSVDILTGGAFAMDTALNAGTGTVSINAGGAVTQTAALTAANLDLLGAGASYSLSNPSNSIGTLAANTGAVSLTDGSSLTVGAVNATIGVISSGAISLSSNGPSTNLTLADVVSAGLGSNVVLAATGDFINNAGASAVEVALGGRWLIYSALPGLTGGDTFGGLNSNNTAVWDTAAGGAVSASGNRYVFAFQPTLTFTSTNGSKTYGTDATTQIQSDFSVSAQPGVANAYLGDTASALYSGAPVLSSSGATASAQVSGGPYTITVAQGSVTTSDGYAFGSANTGQLTINPLAISASLTGSVVKTYDGTTDASLASGDYTLNGIVPTDAANLSLTASSGAYDTKDAGNGKTVAFSGFALSGSAALDYSLSTVAFSGAVGTINPLALTASLVGNVTKTYDGTTDASLTGANYALSASIGADVVSLVPVTSGTYDTKDAGTGKTVSVSGLALTGAQANDYSVASNLSGAVGTINPLALTANLVGNVTKTYDGTTDASLTSGNYVLPGVVIGDSVALNDPVAGTYDTKDAGTGKTVTVNGLSLAGPTAGDYTVASSVSGAVGTINPLALTASLAGNVTKTYDGTTDASLTGANYALSASIGADVVSLVPVTSGTYDTKDAGTGKTVSVSGLALTGAQANDYSVASDLSAAIGVINPLALTASLVGNVTKTYDGTTDAASALAGGGYTLSTPISGDSVGLAATGASYDTKDVGTGKTVTFTGLALTGAQANDYSLSTASLFGNVGIITPLAITANLTGPISRVYDGTTTANLIAGNYVFSGLVSGDSVGLNDPAFGIYDTKDAGTGKTVTVNGLALTGAQAADYSIASSVSAAIGTVTPLALTARLTGATSRTYDGTTNAALSSGNYVLAGAVSGDSVALNDPTFGTYDTKDVGTGKTVSVTGLTLIGAQAADYSIASSVAGPIGAITPLALTARLTGTVSRVYDGTTTANLIAGNYVLSGLVSGDSVGLNDPAFGIYDTKDVGTGKTVTVNGLALTGAQAADYSIASSVSAAIGTVTPLALTARLTGTVNKTYDGATEATLTPGDYVLAGAVSGDNVALNDPTSGTYDTKDVGTGKTVTVMGLALTGAQANDYTVASSVAGPVGTITAKALTVGLTANDKTYDATSTDTGSATLTGAIPGDQVALTAGTFIFTDPNAGADKTVEVTGVALTGADTRNYSLSVSSSTTADIAARPITISANDLGKLLGQADPPLTYSISSGGLAGSDQVSGALARTPGAILGTYPIDQGTLALSANYVLNFVQGVFTIAPPTPGVVAFPPANAQSSNAGNGPGQFTTGRGDASVAAQPAPGAGPFSPLQADDNSGAPYPDNRHVSDKIRFTIGTNP